MKEERIEILKMVSDGKITVDEAERLLEALEKGTAETEEAGDDDHRHHGRHGRRFRRSKRREFRKEIDLNLEGVTDFLKDVGSAISSAVSDALGTPRAKSPEESGYEQVELGEDGTFKIDEGAHLRTNVDRGGFSNQGGQIEVILTEDEMGRAETDGRVALWRREDEDGQVHLLILWEDGDLTLEIPQGTNLESLALRTSGGDIVGEIPTLKAECLARTMGGDIKLAKVATPFNIKTMGGDIELTELCAKADAGSAKTMGGNVVLTMAEGNSVAIKAATMAGDISVDRELGSVEHDKGYVRQKSYLTIGEGTASINAVTMGGSVVVRKAESHE